MNTDLTSPKPTLVDVDQTSGVVELDFDKSINDGVPPSGISPSAATKPISSS